MRKDNVKESDFRYNNDRSYVMDRQIDESEELFVDNEMLDKYGDVEELVVIN